MKESNWLPPDFSDESVVQKWSRWDSNPEPTDYESGHSGLKAVDSQQVTTPADSACTAACTRNPETEHESAVETPSEVDQLAAAIAKLTPAERARLAALLGVTANERGITLGDDSVTDGPSGSWEELQQP